MIFNEARHKLYMDRNQKYYQESAFYHFIAGEMQERLTSLAAPEASILFLDDGLVDFFQGLWLRDKFVVQKIEHFIIGEDLGQQLFDVILMPFALHWVNDVVGFLCRVRNSLAPDGIFIANFAGDGSLNHLRQKLLELEGRYTQKHCVHISPFIRFDHVAGLLAAAGFVENVIDSDNIGLEHEVPLSLMRNIKLHGQSNALKSQSLYAINKAIYQELKAASQGPFVDRINLVTIVAAVNKNRIKAPSVKQKESV
jgi:SAM-dependent methyltransferase